MSGPASGLVATAAPAATVLSVRSLTRRFGGLPAVDGVSLDVAQGEILAVVGPNGAGKTTLLRLLAGTLAPTSSAGLRFAGEEVGRLPAHRRRRLGMATVRQHPGSLPSLSVLDDVAVGAMFGSVRRPDGPPSARAIAAEQLRLLGLADLAATPPRELTPHQRRGVELARALAGRPRLLLLDEPMAGRTPEEVRAAVTALRRIRDERGVTMLWVEHDLAAVAALADRVLVLHLGRRLAEGPPARVLREPAVVEAYLGRTGEAPC